MSRRIEIDCAELRRLYTDEQLGIMAIAQRYGCSGTTIGNRLRACNIQARPSRFQPIDIPLGELRRLYEVEGVLLREIAGQFGVSMGTILNRLRVMNLTRRRQCVKEAESLYVCV